MRRVPTAAKPLTVAHRAGNDPSMLSRACRAGVDLIEADIHWSNRQLEVRHLKEMGPVPLLWDRWKLASGWKPRLLLEDVLPSIPPGCEIMLDLKDDIAGHEPDVLDQVRRLLPGREYSVCSQRWTLLAPFHGQPGVRVVHSVGNSRLLREVLPHLERHHGDAISINKRLLSPAVVEALLHQVSLVMTWPVNHLADLRLLQSWGVNGIISDSLPLLEQLTGDARSAGD